MRIRVTFQEQDQRPPRNSAGKSFCAYLPTPVAASILGSAAAFNEGLPAIFLSLPPFHRPLPGMSQPLPQITKPCRQLFARCRKLFPLCREWIGTCPQFAGACREFISRCRHLQSSAAKPFIRHCRKNAQTAQENWLPSFVPLAPFRGQSLPGLNFQPATFNH